LLALLRLAVASSAGRARVIVSRQPGNTLLATAAGAPLTELLLRSFGPRQVLAAKLAGPGGGFVDAAFIRGVPFEE
jgi:hypothetical protein